MGHEVLPPLFILGNPCTVYTDHSIHSELNLPFWKACTLGIDNTRDGFDNKVLNLVEQTPMLMHSLGI